MPLSEPGWISLEPQNHTVFEILLSFIDNASADPASIQRPINTTIASLRSVGTVNPSVDQYRFESRVLFGILLTIVMQLDTTAVQQDNMINLVLALRRVPLPVAVGQDVDPLALDGEMNGDLIKLIMVWSDLEQDAPLHPRLEDRPGYVNTRSERPPWRPEPGRWLTAGEWTNLNAFMARLHTAAPDLPKVDLRGLFAMIEALEQPLTPSQLEDVLPAAACWVVYAGEELRRNDTPYAHYDDDGGSKRLPWSKGQLWNGPHAFNQVRWQFWMQRFKDIAGRRDIDDTTRSAALQALEAGS